MTQATDDARGTETRRLLAALPQRRVFSGRSLVEWCEWEGLALWWFSHMRYQEAVHPLGTRPPRSPSSGSDLRFFGGSAAYATAGRLLGSFLPRVDLKAYRKASMRVLTTASHRGWRRMTDQGPGKAHDWLFEPIVQELRNRGAEVAGIYPLAGSRYPWFPLHGGFRVSRERRTTPGEPPLVVFDRYWGTSAASARRRAIRHFRRVWRRIEKAWDTALVDIPGSDKISLWLRPLLRHLIMREMPQCVAEIVMARAAVADLRPDLVLARNEYAIFERALIVAAREAALPALALQHGIVHERHYGYMHPRGALDAAGSFRFPFAQVADRTALFGPAHRDLLVGRGGWHASRIVVTGHPLTDRAFRMKQDGQDADGSVVPLDPGKTTLTWLSQTHGSSDHENRANVAAVYQAVRTLGDVRLVIKLHPGEDQSAPFYRSAGGVEPCMVRGDADLYGVLAASDVCMTKASTAAIEALAFDLPLIVLNLSGEADVMDFVQEGVALGVYRAQDLLPALERLRREDPLAPARERYVARQLYRIDGQSSARIAEEALGMIKASRNDRVM